MPAEAVHRQHPSQELPLGAERRTRGPPDPVNRLPANHSRVPMYSAAQMALPNRNDPAVPRPQNARAKTMPTTLTFPEINNPIGMSQGQEADPAREQTDEAGHLLTKSLSATATA